MNHQEIVERVDRTYDEFRTLIDSVPPERALEVVPAGEWCVRDIVGHIAWWEQRAADDILGTTPQSDGASVDERNAIEYAHIASRSFEETLTELDRAHAELTAAIRAHPDVTVDQVEPDTWEHYQEHGDDIRAWLDAAR